MISQLWKIKSTLNLGENGELHKGNYYGHPQMLGNADRSSGYKALSFVRKSSELAKGCLLNAFEK